MERTGDTSACEATLLLRAIDSGDATASHRLFELLHGELRRLAASLMRSERRGHVLQPTALVHEAWIRLAGGSAAMGATGRAHFMAIAARAMRQVLVDHARAHRADKRGGGIDAVTLDDVAGLAGGAEEMVDAVALGEALEQLEKLSPRQCRVVELRVFAGMTIGETADALGVATSTVENDWAMAKAWLRTRLSAPPGGPRRP